MQPQVRLSNSVRTHHLSRLLRLTILVRNTSISNGVHHMHALLAHLPRQGLR